MTRRRFTAFLLPTLGAWPARATEAAGDSIEGKLIQGGPAPALELSGGKRIELHGDGATLAVLNDIRLKNFDLEAIGHFAAPGRFEVGLIHTQALFVHQNGKRLMISYWCDVCYIRTYSPGPCWCCQKPTDLQLSESLDPE